MKRKLTLKEIQRIELDILIYLDEMCRKNNIDYSLSSGTLLGAIKYQGFIPWDDDIDVLLTRDNYMKLMDILGNQENRYRLFSIYNNKDYYYPFAKLVDTNTIIEENSKSIPNMGLYIDIMPIDGYLNNKSIEKEMKSIKFIRNMAVTRFKIKNCIRNEFAFSKIESKTRFKFIKNIIYKLIDMLSMPLGYNYWVMKLDKKLRKVDVKNCVNVGVRVKEFGIKETYKRTEIAKIDEYLFENHKFKGFKNYDLYLTKKYGDYKKELSASEKKTHHQFVAYMRDEK